MDTSKARRQRMEQDFGGLWNLHRVPAVNGQNMSQLLELMGQENYDRIAPYISEDRSPNTINRAELGCILSHLMAIHKAYDEGHSVAMIVEDDITPLFMYVVWCNKAYIHIYIQAMNVLAQTSEVEQA
jgi:GR25 family glycosyltransferase involved in LPS biosynthesis